MVSSRTCPLGVPATKVRFLGVAKEFFGTWAEAKRVAGVVGETGVGSIVVITQPHHARRTHASFEGVLPPATGLFVAVFRGSAEPLAGRRRTLQADLLSRLAHPRRHEALGLRPDWLANRADCARFICTDFRSLPRRFGRRGCVHLRKARTSELVWGRQEFRLLVSPVRARSADSFPQKGTRFPTICSSHYCCLIASAPTGFCPAVPLLRTSQRCLC